MERVISKKEIWRREKISWGILLTILGISTMALVKVVVNQSSSMFSVAITIFSLFLLLDTKSARYYNRPTKYITWIFLYSTVTVFLSLLYSFDANHSISEMPFGILYQGCFFVQIILLWNCKNLDSDYLSKLFFWYTGFLGIIALIIIVRDPSLTGGAYFITGLNNQEGEMIVTRTSTGVIGVYTVFSALAYTKQNNKIEYLLRFVFLGVGVMIALITNRRTVVGAIAVVIIIHLFELFSRKRISSKAVFKIVSALLSSFLIFIVILPLSNDYFFSLINESLESLTNAVGNFIGITGRFDMSANMRRMALETAMQELSSTPLNQIIFGHGYGSWWMDIPVLESFWELGILGGTVFTIIQIIIPITFILRRTEEPLLLFLRYCLVIRLTDNFTSGTCYGTFFIIVLYVLVEENIDKFQGENILDEN